MFNVYAKGVLDSNFNQAVTEKIPFIQEIVQSCT